MRINTNVSSLTAQENAINTNKNIQSSLEKLSSGLRINKASDDASGLSIADKLRTQVTSINQGVSNGNSAITLMQIADKSMAEQSNILDVVKAKLIQANTDTTSDEGRESIRKDIVKLLEQLDNIAEQTNYNGNTLLQTSQSDQGLSNSLSFQIGERETDVISNTSIQSNTVGLGSQVSHTSGDIIQASGTITVASEGTITFTGTNSSGSSALEKIELDGDVDTLELTAGMVITNADADTAAALDALGASKVTESGGTYTVTVAGDGDTLTLAHDTVEATVEINTSSDIGDTITVASGALIDNTDVTTGSTLADALADDTLFTEVSTGIYLAKSAQTIDINVGDSVDVTTLTEIVSGSSGGTFNAGDTITATAVTGGLLDNALTDTNLFTITTAGVYTVNDDFTAGSIFLGDGDSISIAQGNAVSLGFETTGLTTSGFAIDGDDLVRASTGSSILNLDFTTASGGAQYQASGEDALTFNVRADADGSSGTTVDFILEAGDIITFNDVDTTTGGTAGLSMDILESGNFYHLGGNEYQLKEDISSTGVGLGFGDTMTVERLVGGNSTPVPISGPTATTEIGEGSAASVIELTTDSSVDITNVDTTAGNVLTLTSDGTNAIN